MLNLFDRRTSLKIGSLGIGGLTLPNLLRHEARAAEETGVKKRRKAVILLWLAGGAEPYRYVRPQAGRAG